MEHSLKTAPTLLIALAVGACAPTVKVDVTLVTAACVDPPAGPPLDPLAGVQFLRFVSISNGTELKHVVVPVAAGTADLPSFAVGTGRIDVEGTSDGSETARVLSAGSSGDFQIPDSRDVGSIALTIFLRRAGAFSWANSAAAPGSCSGLTTPRAYHTQVLLSDGRVLIYGGVQFDGGSLDWNELLAFPPKLLTGANYLGSVEIYDPATGLFSQVGSWPEGQAGDPLRAQAAGAAASEGAALLLGGESPGLAPGSLVPSPNGQRFALDAGGPPWGAFQTGDPHERGCLAVDRTGHPLLSGGYGFAQSDGGLMVGTGDAPDPASDPPTDQVVSDLPTAGDGGLTAARAEQGCTGFSQGPASDLGLLLYGGGAQVGAGIVTFLRDIFFYQYLPEGAGAFQPYLQSAGAAPVTANLAQPRARPKVARLALLEGDGGVSEGALITGGLTCDLDDWSAPSCQVAGLGLPPYSHFIGRGASADGGLTPMNAARGTELVHFPGAVQSDRGPDMIAERIEHCAVTLADGRVVILGGVGGSSSQRLTTQGSAETTVAVPGTPIPALEAVAQPLLTPRAGMACTLLADGSVLVTGGFQISGGLTGTVSQVLTLGSAEIFRVAPPLIVTR